AQHAAGGARLGRHGVFLARQADRVRPYRQNIHCAHAETDRRLRYRSIRLDPASIKRGGAREHKESVCGPSEAPEGSPAKPGRRVRAGGGGAPRALESACGPSEAPEGSPAKPGRRVRAGGGGAPPAYEKDQTPCEDDSDIFIAMNA